MARALSRGKEIAVKQLRVLFLVAIACWLSGCASLASWQYAKVQRLTQTSRRTTLDCQRPDHCATTSPIQVLREHRLPQQRHVAAIVDQGEESLIVRIHLIRSARQRIDLQTYIFDKDDSAQLVMSELIAAAQRGVHVRVLIDQLSVVTDLSNLAALATFHQNFELRIYNPTFHKAKPNYLDYAASVICCFRRFNQRMHNKLLVIDDDIGIVGGRNYQNDYYDWDQEYNFRDRDVLVVGPVATQMRANFEAYWQAKRSIPVERLDDVARLLLHQPVMRLSFHPYLQPDKVARVSAQASDWQYIQQHIVQKVIPVQSVQYVADLPHKHRWSSRRVDATDTPKLDQLIGQARQEVILQTPYLVMSREAVRLFRSLHQRADPPKIIVSSNSLAATDNPIVYALSYKYKRRNLRELGFNIYEFKPFPEVPQMSEQVQQELHASYPKREQNRLDAALVDWSAVQRSNNHQDNDQQAAWDAQGIVGQRVLRTETRPVYFGARAGNHLLPVTRFGPRMGLHAKSLVVDRRVSVIGTHNFDPRSENYNTEGAVVIDDPVFAQALAKSIMQDISPDNAWVVAPRRKARLFGRLSDRVGKVSEWLPILDFWPWRYATNYVFLPSERCPIPLSRSDTRFHDCYRSVGDFPEVNVGPKWLLVRMLTAFGAGLVPIL